MANKIAIIEDDQAIRDMYELKLKHSGYEVKTATNGKEGLELLKNYDPDLVLLDLMMPEMNGEELLLEYRQMPEGEKTKVIVLTNVSTEESSESLSKLNIEDYIVKANHTPAQVIEIVEAALKKH
jgi:DNA-binding response OmpR family regulator